MNQKTDKRLRKEIFLGDPKNTPLEERVFNGVLGLVCILAVAATVTNALFTDLLQVAITLAAAIVSGSLYLYSRKTKKFRPLILPTCCLFLGIIALAWESQGGTTGSVPLWFFLLVIVSAIVLEGRQRTLFILLALLVIAALLFKEGLYQPAVAAGEKSRLNRLGDMTTSIFLCLLVVVFVVRIVINEHMQDRENIRKALEEIKTLKGFLPICAKCKKIRDSSGYWNNLEKYVESHSEAEFTHGLCPECLKKQYDKGFTGDRRAEIKTPIRGILRPPRLHPENNATPGVIPGDYRRSP